MTVPVADTQADLFKRVLIAEEASTARANHKEQCAKTHTLPEIVRLQKEQEDRIRIEAQNAVAEHQFKNVRKENEKDMVAVFSRDLLERVSKSSSSRSLSLESIQRKSITRCSSSASVCESGDDDEQYSQDM